MNIKHFLEVYPLKRLWRKFWICFAGLPMLPQCRSRILKLGGVKIKGRVLIYSNVVIDTVAPDRIFIGNNVAITSGVKILTHYLNPNVSGRKFRIGEVHICDDVFIGVNACICNSVTIGKGAIIGAGSVVTKDIPPYEVWAGNPAKFIKYRAH
jgi:acetyltransferase-like isoleucine patch superfamily enzyme